MKILVVGGGGREHALCWRIARGRSARRIYCAPGNPGTARCAENVALAADDIDALAGFATGHAIDLTVVGPEAPLCAGIQERFEREGLLLAGPSARAAQLEGSKAFAKEFMARHAIPTAPYAVFEDPDAAGRYIDQHPAARVVKADGLAAGKGVFVCDDAGEAQRAARELLGGSLGPAGRRVVVEHRIRGEEASFIVLTDGQRSVVLPGSQDHKAVFDGDRGPNTGGMGAYSPAPILAEELQRVALERVVRPTLAGLAQEGIPYRGFLYVGLMIADGEPHVLEYNCRMGDPETQPLMARIDDDLVPFLVGAAEGRLPDRAVAVDARAALCIVLAAGGYPGRYETGHVIEGLERAEQHEGVTVFHAGTALRDGRLVTTGGRVLGVTALGDGITEARDRAYAAAEMIRWEGVHFRRDIGGRALGG